MSHPDSARHNALGSLPILPPPEPGAIPDNYACINPALVELLKAKVTPHL